MEGDRLAGSVLADAQQILNCYITGISFRVDIGKLDFLCVADG